MSKPYLCISCAGEYPKDFCLEIYDGREYCKELLEESTVEALELSFDEPVEPKEMKDPVSTGRKRAAVMYPIVGGQVCEWSWRKHCGGGVEPIVGCTGRPASHIHHGPSKSTLDNERNNISLVCEFCHNRWHSANDKYYIEPRPKDNGPWLPIKFPDRVIYKLEDIQKATKQEILMNELLIPEGGKDAK